jgi:uncharacterized LabA/DUF88 family protein
VSTSIGVSNPPGVYIQGRVIAFVDAGFLQAEGRKRLDKGGQPKPQRKVDGAELVRYLREELVTQLAGGIGDASWDFIRAYWYDGKFDAGHSEEPGQQAFLRALAKTPGLIVRLGRIQETSPQWQYAVIKAVEASGITKAAFEQHFTFHKERKQKGVDTLLVLDIVRGAQVRAYDDAIIIAGDADLHEAITTAQDLGRRITLVHPAGAGVSRTLAESADSIVTIPDDVLERILPTK